MNRLPKWMMMVLGMTATSIGVTAPAWAEISPRDVAVIARACVAIDRGEVAASDLSMLNDEEYAALIQVCGFVADGSVSQSEMASTEEYYSVFQSEMVTFTSYIEEHTEEYSVEIEESHEESSESYEEGSEENYEESSEVSDQSESYEEVSDQSESYDGVSNDGYDESADSGEEG